mmetsp:Transcript_57174/g.127634  ORF Transcript_57174/g.127634 Transcript_57174/m.127634 type:complete len:420 (-) Transcript_57174:737-1996(-)|eukprot:CAMPEP_0181257914 /NCGR_PEP_ID=MMETSP1096-20121128/50500_1 /TAXON_ID=156174 ORGANISM="Chrysochromulina ericina, Strain CCMP281" /NCGR_SAMPLE_ID=MMETSP1096 /ASSEMBLY_ACC=CAM_ASM_000453 /LENGTH=419 /DNA_ID=CAMNT_0023356267 /DNA_START=14 /DNA_END=1273 /DNA_ORIENTATION=-
MGCNSSKEPEIPEEKLVEIRAAALKQASAAFNAEREKLKSEVANIKADLAVAQGELSKSQEELEEQSAANVALLEKIETEEFERDGNTSAADARAASLDAGLDIQGSNDAVQELKRQLQEAKVELARTSSELMQAKADLLTGTPPTTEMLRRYSRAPTEGELSSRLSRASRGSSGDSPNPGGQASARLSMPSPLSIQLPQTPPTGNSSQGLIRSIVDAPITARSLVDAPVTAKSIIDAPVTSRSLIDAPVSLPSSTGASQTTPTPKPFTPSLAISQSPAHASPAGLGLNISAAKSLDISSLANAAPEVLTSRLSRAGAPAASTQAIHAGLVSARELNAKAAHLGEKHSALETERLKLVEERKKAEAIKKQEALEQAMVIMTARGNKPNPDGSKPSKAVPTASTPVESTGGEVEETTQVV